MSVNGFLEVTPRPRPSAFDLNAFRVAGNISYATRSLRAGLATMRSGGNGVDIVCIGTSLTRGFNDSTNWTTGWVHRLKVALQGALNLPGTIGGYGYMRSWDVLGGIRNDSSFITTSGAGISQNTGGTTVTRTRLAQNATARTNRLIMQFNGQAADAVSSRRGVTSIDLLVHGAAASTTADGRVDIQYGSAPGLSAGANGSFTVDTQTTPLTSQYPDARVTYGSLDNAVNLFFQIGNGTTTPGALNDFWTAGVIAYNGDEATGVRVHNLGFPGGTSSNFISTDELTCNVSRWCAGGSRATNAKLFIIELGYNDYRTGIALATTQANINTIINTIQASVSNPGIIILIPPMAADGVAGWAGANGAAMQLNAWLYNLAATRQGIAVVDILEDLAGSYNYTSASVNGYLTALQGRGFNDADLIHWSAAMQPYISSGLFNLIMSGLQN